MKLARYITVALGLSLLVPALTAQQPARPNDGVLKEIQAHHQGLAVWWIGNGGWLIKSR